MANAGLIGVVEPFHRYRTASGPPKDQIHRVQRGREARVLRHRLTFHAGGLVQSLTALPFGERRPERVFRLRREDRAAQLVQQGRAEVAVHLEFERAALVADVEYRVKAADENRAAHDQYPQGQRR